jgi:methanogenic corrinoid protein MtbC1
VTQFKFDSPNHSADSHWTSEYQDTKLNYELGNSPRLVGGTTFSSKAAIDQTQVRLLTDAAVHSIEETRKILMKWRRQGQCLRDIYLHGIAESARLIGELWSSDEIDFVNVTIALSRLHQIMEELSPEFLSEGNAAHRDLSLLLMSEPDSQHGLGAFMLSEFFRQAGWRVTLAAPQDIEEFKRLFLSDWFDAVALSISTDRQIDAVSEAVSELRKEALNPQLKIYVGGPMAYLCADELNWTGTSLLQTDAAQAVQLVTQEMTNFKTSSAETSHAIGCHVHLEKLGKVNKM